MKRRLGVFVLVVGLVAAACGSRTSDQATVARGGDAGGEPQTETPDPTLIGESPCSDGDATGATDVGVTDDSITIANVADVDVPGLPGLFQQNQEATAAFVAYCNSLGGVQGRELVLETFDSKLTEHLQAVEGACNSTFAMVGNGVVFDDAGIPAMLECGIPNIPGFVVSLDAADEAELTVQPLPSSSNTWSVGPGRYAVDTAGDAVKKAAIYAAPASARERADQQKETYEQIGFDWIIDDDIGVGDSTSDWQPRVKAMQDQGVEYVSVVGEDSDLATFLLEASVQGFEPEWVEAIQQVYTPSFIETAGDLAEGVHVVATTVPFEEAESSEMLQTYLEWLDATTPGATPDALGVQSWSAGLLYATAASALGSELTRSGLVEELHTITEWDGLGVQAPANPGDDLPTECFVMLRVQDGAFVREFPDEGFACDPDNVATLEIPR